ncbi:MAG: TrkH family potassium uptake protein [bacterium]|nr:TrkH family potassium uptake protein [Candidatus Margulisiibacteriota bacterium]
MFKIRPSLIILISFLVVIFVGTALLHLPLASASGQPTDFIDAYFTANSATCVTGLVVLDTGTYFSLFGLFVILVLIQIGGLGYMTFSTFLVLMFRRKMFISEKLMIMEALNIYSARDVIYVLRRIFSIVFIFEGIGAIILFFRFLPELGFAKALLYGVFHSVSAFCNAGFSLPANYASLTAYAGDWVINLTITSLIIVGGIGFLVIADILQFKRWSLHTKTVLAVTFFLIFAGTIIFFLTEYNNPFTIGGMPLAQKGLVSYFQAITPRTAGFNTISMNHILGVTALFTIFFMFVGASPGGSGGGVKTTTFILIFSTIWATLRNSRDTVLFDRRIPAETVRRAFTITFLSIVVISVSTFLLNGTERFELMAIVFETFSAFGTVGLSMGITPYLTAIGKIIISVTMFIGRIGALTLLLALTIEQKESSLELPKEGISIG